PKVIALARPLAHTREHRESAVVQGNVIDELHDDNRLADPRTSEESDLASLAVGLQQIDDLDACFKHFRLGLLIFELRSRSVNRVGLLRLNRAFLVDRFPEHVDETTERFTADRNGNRGTRILNVHSTRETIGGGHGYPTHSVFAKVLGHFKRQSHNRLSGGLIFLLVDLERVIDVGEMPGGKLYVHHRSDHLYHFSCAHKLLSWPKPFRASPRIPSFV